MECIWITLDMSGEKLKTEKRLLKLETDHYDFVVLDIMMPEMDGLSVCKEIRKTSDVPIIFLTAKGEEWNRVNGLRMGADDYIVKPFSPGELVARMEAVLRRYTKQEQQEEIQFGPILINEKADELRRMVSRFLLL